MADGRDWKAPSAAGIPARCSPECAQLLVPYWDECRDMIGFMGEDAMPFDVEEMDDFIEPCTQALELQISSFLGDRLDCMHPCVRACARNDDVVMSSA